LPNRVSLNASKPNVAIIGAGVIGLGVAWRLAARDASVAVFDNRMEALPVPESLAGVFFHRSENVHGVFLRLIFVE
jgi:2-polyprenyl-6-methoxyphenol hydroxylase-like FAD-dependent oxidoreductase